MLETVSEETVAVNPNLEDAPPPNPNDDDPWLTLKEAEELTGIKTYTFLDRINRGRIEAGAVQRVKRTGGHGGARTAIMVRKSAVLAQPLPNPKYTAGAKRGRKRMTDITEAQIEVREPTPAKQQRDPVGNHISYAAGHCQAWLEVYAMGNGLPVREVVAAVAEVLGGSK